MGDRNGQVGNGYLKRKSLVCLAVLCFPLLGMGQSESGGALTGLNLREDCAMVGQMRLSAGDYAQQNACLFYVSGVVDGFEMGEGSPKFCIPQEATLGEMALVVSKYLNRYPERLHSTPVSLVIDALATAFPCEASPPNK
jgi:hypothetical protein